MPDESAILIPVPKAEKLVGAYRSRYDPAAKAGIPAHITLLYPFLDREAITRNSVIEVREVIQSFHPFDFFLVEVRRFPGVLYLHPEPDNEFKRMTQALVNQFPDHPPYKGAYSSVNPHLTVAHADDAVALEAIVEKFQSNAESYLPMKSRAEEVWLMMERNGKWRKHTSFTL